MQTRRIFLIILVIIIGVSALKAEHIKKFIAEEKYYNSLVRLGIIHKCYYLPGFEEMFAQEGFDYQKTDQQITLSSLNKLESQNKDVSTIPKITHHVYFSPTVRQVKLTEFYIEKIKANFNRLNSIQKNWQHYIWTNNPNLFAKLSSIDGVVFKDISEFKGHLLYPYIVNKLGLGENTKAYYMEISDIVRLLALQKHGGIYTDIDYEIYNAKSLSDLLKQFDFIGGRELPNTISFYGNAFIATKPNHPVINEALKLMEKYDLGADEKKIPNYIKYSCNLYSKLYAKSPPLYTIAYFKKNNIDGNNDIILPSWMIFNLDFARQRNGDCEYTKYSKDIFKDEELSKALASFSEKTTFAYGEEQEPIRKDIYYNTAKHQNFDIIGADMFCGTWGANIKQNKKLYYWNWPFSLFIKKDEN